MKESDQQECVESRDRVASEALQWVVWMNTSRSIDPRLCASTTDDIDFLYPSGFRPEPTRRGTQESRASTHFLSEFDTPSGAVRHMPPRGIPCCYRTARCSS